MFSWSCFPRLNKLDPTAILVLEKSLQTGVVLRVPRVVLIISPQLVGSRKARKQKTKQMKQLQVLRLPRCLCLWSGDNGKHEDPGNNGPLSWPICPISFNP